MNVRHRVRRVAILFAVLAIAPLAGVAQVAAIPSFQEEDSEWNGSFETVPADLCQPGAPVELATLFVELEPATDDQNGRTLYWWRTLIVNPQLEIFRVAVYGTDADAVKTYVEQARFCLDIIPTDIPTGDGLIPAATPEAEDTDEVPPENPSDIDVTFDLLGVVEGLQGDPDGFEIAVAVTQELNTQFADDTELVSQLEEVLPSQLQEKGFDVKFTTGPAWVESNGMSFVLDFAVDPPINNGVTHRYHVAWGDSAWFTVRVPKDGVSKVKGKLYASATGVSASKTVPFNGLFERSGSISTSWTKIRLCAIGLANESRYSIWGRASGDGGWNSNSESPIGSC